LVKRYKKRKERERERGREGRRGEKGLLLDARGRGGEGGEREKLSARAPMRSGYPGIIFQVLPLYAEFPRKAIFEIFKIHTITAAKPALIIK
jgi:hypothetical protein